MFSSVLSFLFCSRANWFGEAAHRHTHGPRDGATGRIDHTRSYMTPRSPSDALRHAAQRLAVGAPVTIKRGKAKLGLK